VPTKKEKYGVGE